MEGKVCLITGANIGIGYIAARELAKKGARVVLACRNEQRGTEALEKLKAESGSEKIELMLLDLSSLASVREFAAEFIAKHSTLHLLINNAGLVLSKREVTADGYEATFATNHLGPFLLTNLLLPLLKESAPARIVNVSSAGHYIGKVDFDDLQSTRGYFGFRVYGTTKLENILFTTELARRLEGTGVTANSLHPGTIGSNFGQSAKGVIAWGARVIKPLLLTPEQGAQTTIHLASSPEVEGVSGKYFQRCKPARTSSAARSEADAKRLWEVSEQLSGLV